MITASGWKPKQPRFSSGQPAAGPTKSRWTGPGYHLATACSLATLWYLRAFSELLKVHRIPHLDAQRATTLEIATGLNTTLLIAALFLAIRFLQRILPPQWTDRALVMGFIVVAIRDIVDTSILGEVLGSADRRSSTLQMLGPSGVTGCLVVFLSVLLLCLVRWPKRGAYIASALWPLAVLDLGYAAWWAVPAGAAAHSRLAPPVHVSGRTAKRVVWVIFDELDQTLLFDRRPGFINLPEFDRFRAQSLHAEQAFSPADHTLESIPALVTGTVPEHQAEYAGTSDLLVYSGNREVSWRRSQNLFREARDDGFDVGIAGWFHPYCGIFSDTAMRCFAYQIPPEVWYVTPEADGIWNTIALQFQREFYLLPTWRLGDGRRYTLLEQTNNARIREALDVLTADVMDSALELASDPAIDIAMLHLPAPHLPGHFERGTRRHALAGNYFDNLEMADELLSRLLQRIDQAGLGERTVVLLSSDHPFRREVWRQGYHWDQEMEMATRHLELTRVPFLLKMPGQRSGAAFSKPFNTVLSRDLICGLLTNRIATADDVLHWLDARCALPQPPTFHSR